MPVTKVSWHTALKHCGGTSVALLSAEGATLPAHSALIGRCLLAFLWKQETLFDGFNIGTFTQ